MSRDRLNLIRHIVKLLCKKEKISINRLVLPFVAFVTLFFCIYENTIASDKVVSVYYYSWWGNTGYTHWPDGYLGEKLLPPQPPYLDEYNSNSDVLVKKHLEWSQSYGIDNWICSWWGWGPWNEIDTIIRSQIATNVKEYNTTFCLLYESGNLLKFQNDRIVFDDEDIAKLRSDFDYIATTYFSNPSYYRINNRPVVYFYLTRVFTGEYAHALQLLRQDMIARGYDIYIVGDEVYWDSPDQTRIAAFDAITAYNMHGPWQYAGYPANTNFIDDVSEIFSQYSAIANNLGVDFIPNTTPGFNDRAVRLNVNHYIIPTQIHPDSNNVSTFYQFTKMAINHVDSSINAIDITSFNEWHEGSQIEPTIVAAPTNTDISSSGQDYTLGFTYEGYGTRYLDIVRILLSDIPSETQEQVRSLPRSFLLEQNYPNPFNACTKIEFSIPYDEFVTLEIFNLLGERIATLVSIDLLAGSHQTEWNAGNVPGGVYFYQLNAGEFVQTRKLILLR
ncbi:MAG TPA: glycoside hydrolase family 99-like domain-containing protein [bacterium]|nr:glycoside hydrolase family 99-like domain-containing protein [bacterium]HPN42054.1 glycoside hydrolase family 99-like domain-containing protein [bacterium]